MIKTRSKPSASNPTREKQSLKLKLGAAREAGNERTIEVIQARLQALEEAEKKERERLRNKTNSLNKVNQRNRELNFKPKDQVHSKESKTGSMTDPFARRLTKPTRRLIVKVETKPVPEVEPNESSGKTESPIIRNRPMNKFAVTKQSLDLSLDAPPKPRPAPKSAKPSTRKATDTGKKRLSLADYLKKKKNS